MSKVITETERLLIREFNLDDAQDVFEFNANEEVNRYTGDAGVVKTLEDAKGIITNIWLKEYKEHGYARWAVVLKETNKVIGFCGFKCETRFEGTDIGYRFPPEYWGKGYATEANQACLDYAKEHMDLTHILGDVVQENLGSINVLKKLGFSYQSQYEEAGFKLNRYELFLKD